MKVEWRMPNGGTLSCSSVFRYQVAPFAESEFPLHTTGSVMRIVLGAVGFRCEFRYLSSQLTNFMLESGTGFNLSAPAHHSSSIPHHPPLILPLSQCLEKIPDILANEPPTLRG